MRASTKSSHHETQQGCSEVMKMTQEMFKGVQMVEKDPSPRLTITHILQGILMDIIGPTLVSQTFINPINMFNPQTWVSCNLSKV